jgi:hypothetical protein
MFFLARVETNMDKVWIKLLMQIQMTCVMDADSVLDVTVYMHILCRFCESSFETRCCSVGAFYGVI